jgi:para-nitrobenzyl esterase
MTRISKHPFSATVACAALLAATGCGGSNPTFRSTAFGDVSGTQLGGTYAWLGVPYGKAGRWQAPVDPDRWSGTKALVQLAVPCAQVGNFYGPPPAGQDISHLADAMWKPQGQEDCLYFNLWRPATSESGLPVLVFVHGGSGRVGYASDPTYDGAALAKAGNVMVITVNYRLNHFGWFNHPALAVGEPVADSGNFALLDLIQALKFLKSNVARFGGDPANVTLSGQSAGAVVVNGLLLSPLAAGLFHKAISFSGAAFAYSPSTGQAKANALIDQLLVDDHTSANLASAATYRQAMTTAQIKSYLLAKSASDIINAQINPDANGGTGGYREVGSVAYPLADGTVVPPITTAVAFTHPAIAAGQYNKVPLIYGTTKDEGKLFTQPAFRITDGARFNLMHGTPVDAPGVTLYDLLNTAQSALTGPTYVTIPGSDVATVGANYSTYATTNASGLSPGPAFTTAVFQGVLVNPSLKAFVTDSTQAAQTWAYSFEWARQSEPWATIYGAAHVIDLPFVFGTMTHETLVGCFWTSASATGRAALSSAMQKSIAAFMRTGNPNDPSLGVSWSAAGTPSALKKIHLNADNTSLAVSMDP